MRETDAVIETSIQFDSSLLGGALMLIEKTDNIAESTSGRTALAESLRQLEAKFSGHLSGSRQATRSHLVRYLANVLEIAEQSAERVFDRLQQIGVIERVSKAQSNHNGYGTSEHWRICNNDQAQNKLQQIDDSEIEFSPTVSQDAFAAAEDLLRRAIAARATDIHLDPYADEVEVGFGLTGDWSTIAA